MAVAPSPFALHKPEKTESFRNRVPAIVDDLASAICAAGPMDLKGRIGICVKGREGDLWAIDLSKPHRGFQAIGEDTFQQCETRISLSSATFEGPWDVDGDRGVLQIIGTHLRNFQSAVPPS